MNPLTEVRIDKWLWAVRLYKTRTAAADAIKAGHVKIAGRNVKPSHSMKLNEIVIAQIGDLTRTVKVIALLERRIGAELVSQFLQDLTPESEYQKPREPHFAPLFSRRKGSGRPTKKDRRAIRPFLALSLCAFAFSFFPAPVAEAALRAGAATVNITPPLGIEINGGTHPAIATHVHDELHARALVLDDGATRLAFVVVDSCLIERALFDEAKALVFQHTLLPSNHIAMSCTHTHSAGSVCGAHLSEPDPGYRKWLPRRLADAVRIAVNNLAPARIAWGSGSVPQHVFCRRITVKPGLTYTNLLGLPGDRVKMNWSSPQFGVDDDFSGPVDPEVFVLSVQHTDGRALSLLANYSLHYVGGVGPGHLSADYYGVFCERIGELLGAQRHDPPFVALMSNGTSGDVNNNDFHVKRPAQRPYEQIRLVANDVAREVQRVVQTLRHRDDLALRAASAELKLAYRKPTSAELESARAIVNRRDRLALQTWTEFYAREQLILAGYPDEASLPLQVFRIGDVAVAQWPGEIFAVTGLDLKQRSPLKPLFNISLANGWYGYIPPPEQHAFGAYETWRGRTSPLETNAIPKLTEALLMLLNELK